MRNRFTVQLARHQSEKLISVIPRLFPLPGNIQHSLFLYHCTPCPLVYFLFSSWFFPSNGIGYFPSALRAVCRLAPPVFQPTFLYHPLGHCLLLLDERTLSFSTLNRSVSSLELHIFFARNAFALSSDDYSNDSSPMEFLLPCQSVAFFHIRLLTDCTVYIHLFSRRRAHTYLHTLIFTYKHRYYTANLVYHIKLYISR